MQCIFDLGGELSLHFRGPRCCFSSPPAERAVSYRVDAIREMKKGGIVKKETEGERECCREIEEREDKGQEEMGRAHSPPTKYKCPFSYG